ncbi:MAG TPA: hypothetical protein VJX73_04600 [Terracidiphilus sp.]|nr:hypothetical protein [Terracidiphilus sp.]
MDGGCAPASPGRSCDFLRIQPAGDRPRRIAAGEFVEDAPDDPGLRLVDDAFAPDRFAAGVEPAHDIVAEAVPSSRFAGLHPAPQSAAHFLG